MLQKATTFDMQDINKGKRIAIIKFATYGSLDRDGDMSTKGMFTRSWQQAPEDIRFFKNHNREEAPGRIVPFEDGRPGLWDDEKGAYARLYLGTHTLGEDTLKQMDEGIITNNSFGFDPTKKVDIKGKGSKFTEVKHWEVSVLTHWGAHKGSLVQEVHKSFNVDNPVCVKGSDEVLTINAVEGMFYSLKDNTGKICGWFKGSDLDAVSNGEVNQDAEDLDLQIKSLEKIISKSNCSDAAIKELQLELDDLKSARQLLNDTVDTRMRNDQSISVDKQAAEALLLLTLKFN